MCFGCNSAGGFGSLFRAYMPLNQGSPNYGPQARCGREAISSGPRSHFANDEKITYSTYENFVDLVEYNISHNNHFA